MDDDSEVLHAVDNSSQLDEERKEDESVRVARETDESSQKENVDPARAAMVATPGTTRQARKAQRQVAADMDMTVDSMPVLEQATPSSSLSSLSHPRHRISAAPLAVPELFAVRQPSSTPTYSRQARAAHAASPASAPSIISPTSLPSSKPPSATSSPRAVQRVTSMSMRRKLTTYTLLTSHLDDDQLALVKELEALMNHAHTLNPAAVPTTSHPRVVLTTTYTPALTHLITSASTATSQIVTRRTNKYFLAQLTPHAAIVTIDWVTESIVARRMLDATPYAVRGDSRWPQGGETRRLWYEAVNGAGLLGGWEVGELGVWSNKVVRDDVRAIVQVGGGQWVGSGDMADGAPVAGSTRYVVWDDGKKVMDENRALLTTELVREYEERGISAVPCSWLFDCVSSFSILPIPPLQPQATVD